MRTAFRFLFGAGIFGLLTGTVYWYVSGERAGTALLLLMGVAPIIIAAYLFHRGRTLRSPDDDPAANHEDSSGVEVGHFSGGSVWPIVMGIGCVIGIEGFVYGTWLLVFGLVLFVWAAVGLMQESRG